MSETTITQYKQNTHTYANFVQGDAAVSAGGVDEPRAYAFLP